MATAEERREKDIAEIIGRLSGGRGHVRVQDAATAAYDAGRSAGLEEAAKIADERKNKLNLIREDLAPELEGTRRYIETAEGVLESAAASIRALKAEKK